MEWDWLIKLVLLVAPLYITNSSAMLFGGKTPLDLNKKFFDGRPILGQGKTFKGAVLGLSAGMILVVIIDYFFHDFTLLLADNYFFFGFLACAGAILGDMVASFFKRRLNLPRGHDWVVVDQLDFLAGGLALTAYFYLPSFLELAGLVVLTMIVHRTANFIAFKVKLKKVPW